MEVGRGVGGLVVSLKPATEMSLPYITSESTQNSKDGHIYSHLLVDRGIDDLPRPNASRQQKDSNAAVVVKAVIEEQRGG